MLLIVCDWLLAYLVVHACTLCEHVSLAWDFAICCYTNLAGLFFNKWRLCLNLLCLIAGILWIHIRPKAQKSQSARQSRQAGLADQPLSSTQEKQRLQEHLLALLVRYVSWLAQNCCKQVVHGCICGCSLPGSGMLCFYRGMDGCTGLPTGAWGFQVRGGKL